ncbi:hypothetical protein VTJ49DRAFT_7579 [Mycothermus thermophilus]|uniref:DNA replication checkpoint mediator MRC1 domain-containing protein n=1 Tax=Humicola insolens TaxID=85995 RepID=A0ABR3VH30_HUMIN
MASSSTSSPASRRSRSVSPTTATTRLIMQSRMDALSDASSDGDDEILRPRGKMAARMLARNTEQQEEASEDDDTPITTRSDSPKLTKSTADNNNESEGVVRPARPRKLVPRRQRSRTPEMTAPPAAASSPGLFISPQTDAPGSPGLFVSPSKPQSHLGDHSEDDDDELPSLKNPRFAALVERKRRERLAREAEEARKQAERRKAMEESMMSVDGDDEDDDNITDDDGGRKLTQDAPARAPRKASKKALEEMNRETQRLARSLQLAHEAKVRKKITKATLFERFNFKPEGAGAAPTDKPAAAEPAPSSSRPPTPGSAQPSDVEMKDDDTPPSSPPAAAGDDDKAEKHVAPAETENREDDDYLPERDVLAQQAAASHKLDKGKGKATAADLEDDPKPSLPQKRNFRVKLPSIPVHTATLNLDDEDDLQIVPTRKSKIDAIFDRAPLNQAKESHALQRLRRLANLDDPDRQPAPPSRAASSKLGNAQNHQDMVMSAGELQATLLQRARQQARLERDRQIEELRGKGIHVQTAEERERELQEVEDIVARARKEAEEIMAREREDAKAERRRKKKAGEEDEEDPLGWDDSDDEEYEGEEVEEPEIELSGSEEEDGEEGEEEEDEGEEGDAGKMVDAVAEESEAGEAEDAGDDGSDEELPGPKTARRRLKKQVTIVTDDEDEAEPMVKATPQPKARLPRSPSVRNADSPSVPTSVLRSATKTFIPGLPVAGPAGLGLTQIFAGTMDDSQTALGTSQVSPSQPRPTFDVTAFPDSNFSQTAQDVGGDDMILDSQPARETQQAAETQGVQLGFSQSQAHGFDSFLQQTQSLSQTQSSELIQPTQDEGFHNFSPLRQRFVDPPHSTVDTVTVNRTQVDEQSESPLVRRTGKLRRKADLAVPASPTRRTAAAADDAGDSDDAEADEFGFGTVRKNDAFAALKEAALKEKKRKEAFDKKKSKAREMVEEQAEESEDEYAGLGGADGEDSEDDDDASVKEMIDDETKADKDEERKLAAFYADRERAADERQVEKLFHDITTGMLRRKRTGNWDELSDSDDGGEARRRLKRRQFAKMQRALFADERISKVAENPRNQAFLRTIEDRGSDDEMDFIFAPPPPPPLGLESQTSTSGQSDIVPNSQPQPATAPAAAAAPAGGKNPRRTVGGKKPSNLSEIRESLSNLLDEPFQTSSSVIPATEFGSSDEEEEEDNHDRPQSSHSTGSTSSNKENRNPRRRPGGPKHTPAEIVDRISLKRNASTSSVGGANKLAFATASPLSGSGSGGGFKVPALLRRATTNSLISSSSSTSSGTTTTTGNTFKPPTAGGAAGAGDGMRIRKPAGKRSGISYLARETERRAALAEAERRREAKKVKGAEGRAKIVGGLFGGGSFE